MSDDPPHKISPDPFHRNVGGSAATPSKDGIPTVDDLVALPEDQLDADDLDIPILTELHGAENGSENGDKEQESPSRQPPLFQDLPLPGSHEVEKIEAIVEDLVAEFLPRLEHELRIRLYDYVSGLVAARQHHKESKSD